MKTIHRLAIFFVLVLIAGACSKFNNQEDPQEASFEDLVISDNFNWETTHNVNFHIFSDESGVLKIHSADRQITYHKGYYNHIEDQYTTSVNLSARVSSVYVNNKEVNINSNELYVDLDESSKDAALYKINSIPDEGLISYWQFDENTGTMAADAQNLNPGTISGAEWVPGISGSALDYNGDNGQTLVQNSESLNITGNSISHSLWFKLDHVGDDGAFLFQRMKYIVRIDSLGKMTFGLYNPNWSYATIGWYDRIIDTDWHYLVTTYDGEELKMYLDGVLMDTKESDGNINSSSSDIYIGNQSSINFFDGLIDEAAIYNRALTAGEVSQIYSTTPNQGTGSENLISEWLLDENSGNTAYDSKSDNNGTITGASWAPGVTGSCLEFDGENDYVIMPNATNLNPENQLTIMAWAKTRDNKTCKIAQKGDWDGHGVHQDKWSGWRGHIRLATNNSVSIGWNNGIPQYNEWYHICVTYNGTLLKLFVNGQLKNSQEVSGNLKVNSRTFSIGSDTGAQKYFNGFIDDVRFYSSALSQTEIQAIYNNQETGTDTDGDGIYDDEDDYPNDAGRAFNNYYPAEGYESLTFEDLWPGKGDYDFNDLVLDYRFTIITNANNKVSDLNGSFVVRAIGAGFSNGFGFQFDNAEIQASDMEVNGYELTESYISLNDYGTENEQEKTTIIVFDNAKSILPTAGGFGVNVDPSAPYVEPDTVNIEINFSNLSYSIEDLEMNNFNPFLIIDGIRGKEIHLVNYPPTSLADESYFGTMNDNSNPGTGVYYKTENNLPWVIRFAESFDYTNEKSKITDAYLNFATWAESSGASYTDWYQDKSGYRNNENIYQVPVE